MRTVGPHPRLAALVLAGTALLAGCTDRASGGPGVGTTDPGTTGPGRGTTGVDTGDGCAAFDDAPLGDARTVEIRNASDTRVFLGTVTSCTLDRYRITAEPDPDEGHYPPGACEPTCAALRDDDCACPESCPVGLAIRLEPGGVYRTEWPSVLLVPHELSPTCATGELCPAGACPVRRDAPAGTYRAEAAFFIELPGCPLDGGDPALCDCAPNEDGWCETASLPEGEPYYVDAVFTHPQTDPISIEFAFLP